MLIAVKGLPEAKSRLVPASTDPVAHGALVAAIRADTIAATSSAEGVARIVLVADRAELQPEPGDRPGVSVIVQRSPGLNGALRDGADLAAARWPRDGVAALVGDLPALRGAELAAALADAARHDHAFVADAEGTGTTLLTARSGCGLRPAFGPGSAARHGAHATPIAAGEGLRHDVDTADDLAAAVALGVGPSTVAVLGSASPTERSSAPAACVHPQRA